MNATQRTRDKDILRTLVVLGGRVLADRARELLARVADAAHQPGGVILQRAAFTEENGAVNRCR